MPYSEQDYINLSTFKLFSQHLRPIINSFYPKLPTQKIMALMAAYWREFLELKTLQATPIERSPTIDDPDRTSADQAPSTSANRSRRRRPGMEADETNEQLLIPTGTKKIPSLKIKIQKELPATVLGNDEPMTNEDDEVKRPTKKSSRQRKRKRRGDDDDPSNDSDAEFEAMLVQSELNGEEEEELPRKKRVKKLPKPPKQIARLNNRRAAPPPANDVTLTNDVSLEQAGYETDHQDYCEVCQQGGEIILCDTCPKAYHLVCLDPELEQTPEGDWSCPDCTKNGITVESRQAAARLAREQQQQQQQKETDNHMEFCRVCRDGGELLCCDRCPSSYHMHCLIPPMTVIPVDDWFCPRCTVSIAVFSRAVVDRCPFVSSKIDPPPYVVKKILTWRWVTHPSTGKAEKSDGTTTTTAAAAASTASPEEKEQEVDVQQRLIPTLDPNLPVGVVQGPLRTRELFVKYDGLSYWSCEWLPELQVEVHQSSLWRCYMKKIGDSQNPTIGTGDGTGENEGEEEDEEVRRRYYNPKLEQRYYKNGVRPEWLCVHRILNHQKEKNGKMYFLVKWRDLAYDQSTWEAEKDGDYTHLIDNWQKAIDTYWKFRNDGEEKKKKKSTSAKTTRRSQREAEEQRLLDSSDEGERSSQYPPARKRYEKQPDFVDITGGTLHPYQLEGLNWLRYSFAQNMDVILADEMGLGKTIQTIVFLQALLKEGLSRGPFLISAPLATIINWEREFEFWAPDMYVVTYTGDKEARSVIRQHEFSFEGKTSALLGWHRR